MNNQTHPLGAAGLLLLSVFVGPAVRAGAPQEPTSPTPVQTPAPDAKKGTATAPEAEPVQQPAATPPGGLAVGGVTVSGFLDAYYQLDFNRPPAGTSLGASGRLFDVENNDFTIAAARVNVLRPPTTQTPVGLTVQLLFGANADLLHAYEPGGLERYKALQQAFVTYAGRGARPVTVDVGKFAAWIGYESLDSVENENYSRAFNFNLGQPNYTAGVRASRPLTDRLSATLFAANGFNETEDANGGKTLGAQLSVGPGRPLNVLVNYWGGPEGGDARGRNPSGGYGGVNFPFPEALRVSTGNLIAVWQPAAGTKLVFDGYYTDASSRRANGLGRPGGRWNGQAVYARRQLTPASGAALRLERLEDFSALRTGARRKLHAATVTYDYVVGRALVNRLEFRHDWSSDPYFAGRGDGLRRSRATFTAATAYRF